MDRNKKPERNKRWRVSISEEQALRVSLKMIVAAQKSCETRPDISVCIPPNFNTNEWRIFEGEGDPPEELMALAYFGRR